MCLQVTLHYVKGGTVYTFFRKLQHRSCQLLKFITYDSHYKNSSREMRLSSIHVPYILRHEREVVKHDRMLKHDHVLKHGHVL